MEFIKVENGTLVYEQEGGEGVERNRHAYLVLLGNVFLYDASKQAGPPSIEELERDSTTTMPSMKKITSGELFGHESFSTTTTSPRSPEKPSESQQLSSKKSSRIHRDISAITFNPNANEQGLTVLLRLSKEAYELIITQNTKYQTAKITNFFHEKIPSMRQVYTTIYLANRSNLLHT